MSFTEGVSNESTLAFIEQNKYQSLVILSLVIKRANDETLKRYLAGKYCEQTALSKDLFGQLANEKAI